MENNSNMAFDWSWIVALLIIAGIFGNGFGGFGGNSAGVTEEYIANQFTQRDIFNTNTAVLTSSNDTQKEVLTNRYENALGVASLQKDVLLSAQNTDAQMSSCCLT